MPPAPPQRQAGMRIGPPDFVGVGVQRCGTTRWFDLIAAHPEVVQTNAAKELHFFDRFYAGGAREELLQYHTYFPRGDSRRTGEWTPLYMSAPWIPRLLAAAAPDARLLVILRDPVERYLSATTLNLRVAERRGAALSRYAPLEAFARGFYHSQLLNLLRYFDRSQMLLLQYERCSADPAGELERTYAFLGLSDTAFTPDLQARPKQQADKLEVDAETRRAYADAYRDDVLRLAQAFPEIDLGLWPSFTDLAQPSPAGAKRP